MNILCGADTRKILHSVGGILLFFSLALSFSGCVSPDLSLSNRGTNPAAPLVTEATMVVRGGGYGVHSDESTAYPSYSWGPEEKISLRVYKDPDESLAVYKSFDFDYTSKTNPLLEKELFKQLERALQAHGLTRVKENPQVVISMDFFIGKRERYTPPTTVTNTEIKSVWNTGMIGWNIIGMSEAVPVTNSTTTPGYTTVSYYSNIHLNFLNRSKLVGAAKPETPPLIWIGEADHEGPDSDIRRIASMMFAELAKKFSDQSANVASCYVHRFRYGGLGLSFDPYDWSVIRYVEPSSVAAANGLKPGDVILAINGRRPMRINIPSGHTKAKDPYFWDILSNRGDTDVELEIKPAESEKSVKIRVRPRYEDRYLKVD